MTKRQEFFSKIAYFSFYTAIVIEVMMVLIDKSNYINPIEGRLFQITFLLFFVKVCLTKYSKRELAIMAFFMVLGAVSYFVTGRNEIVRVVMFIAACKEIDMQKCLKLVFNLTLAGCVIIILLSVTGIYGGISLTQDYGRESVETRYTLGMGHPNALQCMVWALTTLLLYLYGKKLKWYHFLLILGVNVGFFLLTDSKTSLLVAAFTILYARILCFTKSNIIKKITCAGGGWITVGSIAVSILAATQAYRIYDYIWHGDRSRLTLFCLRLDQLLTGRIHSLVGTTRWEGTVQTWSLFSTPENNYYFDMGWVRLFYWYGIIPACIGIVALGVLWWYCYKEQKYMELMMIMSFAFYSIVEAHAISVYLARNYVLFLAGMYWCQIISYKRVEKENL